MLWPLHTGDVNSAKSAAVIATTDSSPPRTHCWWQYSSRHSLNLCKCRGTDLFLFNMKPFPVSHTGVKFQSHHHPLSSCCWWKSLKHKSSHSAPLLKPINPSYLLLNSYIKAKHLRWYTRPWKTGTLSTAQPSSPIIPWHLAKLAHLAYHT